MVPSPVRLLIVMAPRRPSTMLREMARPRPVPVRRVVKYGSKIRGRWSGLMPLPRSDTSIAIRVSVSRVVVIERSPGPAARPRAASA